MEIKGETSDPIGINECVLKCKDAVKLYDFPSEDIFRNLWLYSFGLEHFKLTFKVCEKHFSANMISPISKELVDLAVPDKNLPDTSLKKKQIYDQLIKKITTTRTSEKKIEKKEITSNKKYTSAKKQKTVGDVPATESPTMNVPIANISPTDQPMTIFPPNSAVSDWLKDSSNLLMDYQLRLQGKHMCDVIEMPEYIVVFTVCKSKESRTIHLSDLQPSKSKENINPLMGLPSSITVTRTSSKNKPPPTEPTQIDDAEDLQPKIDYVYYKTEDTHPRREREVQVDMLNKTCETAIQCDVQLDNDMKQMSFYLQTPVFDNESTAEEITMHECLVCGEIIGNYESKVRHDSEHENVQTLCSHCGEIFPSQFKLRVHEKDMHSENDLAIKKALRCPKLHCPKAFHSRKRLNQHIEEHIIRNAEHKCNKCLRVFSSSLKLLCHQKAFKNCLRTKWSKIQKWNQNQKR